MEKIFGLFVFLLFQVIPVHAYQWYTANPGKPQFVMIGDSITYGDRTAQDPGFCTSIYTPFKCCVGRQQGTGCDDGSYDPALSYPGQFAALPPNATYSNQGVGGNTSTQIMARWQSAVVDNAPRYVVILMGVNDLNQGVPKAAWYASYVSALNSAVANKIIPVVIAILPWTGGTNKQMLERDDWNASLHSLVNSYPTAVWADCGPKLGYERLPSGELPVPPPGNRWNILWAYGTWVHFNREGYGVLAQCVHDAIANAGRTY